MKYKIEIRTFANGSVRYAPFVEYIEKNFWGKEKSCWWGLSFSGIEYEEESRDIALAKIDEHYNTRQNCKIVSIEIEYITK